MAALNSLAASLCWEKPANSFPAPMCFSNIFSGLLSHPGRAQSKKASRSGSRTFIFLFIFASGFFLAQAAERLQAPFCLDGFRELVVQVQGLLERVLCVKRHIELLVDEPEVVIGCRVGVAVPLKRRARLDSLPELSHPEVYPPERVPHPGILGVVREALLRVVQGFIEVASGREHRGYLPVGRNRPRRGGDYLPVLLYCQAGFPGARVDLRES